MRFCQSSLLVLLAGLCGAALVGAAETHTVVLDDSGAEPDWQLLRRDGGGLVVDLDVPRLELETVEEDGRVFTRIEVEGGNLTGQPGRPALPVLSRLCAVPEGMTVRVKEVRTRDQVVGEALLPLPAQRIHDQGAKAFDFDRDYYLGAGKAAETRRAVAGEPARLHGVRVVPLNLYPVTWDRGTGLASASARMEVELEYVPAAAGEKALNDDRPLPASFATLLEETALGFDKSAVDIVPLGTWLCIAPDDAAVAAAVEPLVEWRRRQGYHVVSVTTTEAGTTASAIKSYLTDQYNGLKDPLEMVCLVGDANGTVALPSWEENLSGYTGEGDHPYTQLDGDDVLADVHLGRLSATSATELTTIVDKIVKYESEPHVADDLDWFTTAGLTGDPSTSGYSTIWVNQWVKEQLIDMNYTRIDTIWDGNFVSLMMATINQGESLFTYRGYWNMSGLNTGYIGSLGNQQKLPYAVILTCDTGSFWSDPTCRSEAFLRAPNGGGVASIGTATIGTHTRYNNSMFLGILDNVLASGDPRFGPSLTRGKLNMYANYFDNEPEEVEIWSTWNNLMGDPATAMWSAVPTELAVTLPDSLGSSATAVEVQVEAGGQPVPDAIVAAYLQDVVSVHAVTGADGRVVLPLDVLTDGELLITVTGVNLMPWLGGVNVGAQSVSLDPVALVVDDDSDGASQGDGDGFAEPGEIIELGLTLENGGTGGASAVTATLASPNAGLTVLQDTADFGYLGGGAQASGDAPYVVQIDAAVPGGAVLPLEVTATSGAQVFAGLADLEVSGPAARLASTLLAGGAGLDPGETGTVRVTVINSGDAVTSGATLTLSTNDNWVTVIDGDGTLPAIANGDSAGNGADLFTISVAGDCIPGHLAVLNLDVAFVEGGIAQLEVPVTFGTVSESDPTGPGRYPYYAFDSRDAAYDLAPTYDWVEIDPAVGGAGTSVGLTDFSRYDDDTKVIDLPFTFRYYDQDFDRISICSNGWFAFGATYQRFYRNWSLPAPGSPDNLVAVFWDELYAVSGDGGVFTWYDAANHRFVIEWRRMRNYEGGAIETFQAILTDPAHEAGDTGDGRILMQYETFNQTDAQNGYCTIGIQNEDRTDALLYSYWNAYTGGSVPMQAGRAILFTTVEAQIQGTLAGNVTNLTAGGAPVEGARIDVLGSSRSLVSAGNGSYIGGVPIGTYDLAISHPSFAPDTTRGVTISEETTTTVDFALVDIAGPSFDGTVIPDATDDTTGPYIASTVITDESGIAEMHAYYTSSATGGPFEVPLTATGAGDEYEISIPGQPSGTLVQFWFTGRDLADNKSQGPAGGPFDPYTFAVTTTSVLFSDDMEAAGAWVVGDGGDTANSGLWERADPNGVFEGATEVQPEDDHTDPGAYCWITGNDPLGSSQGTDDVDGGATTLYTPLIDATGSSELELRYWRWYTNNTGYSPNEDSWIVQAAFDGGSWITLENTTVSERAWSEQVFLLEEIAPELGNEVQLRFIASDDGSGSVVEAGVDDLTLVGFDLMEDAAPPAVDLTAPDGGESIAVGAVYDITWVHSDDTGVVEARLWLSTDGGSSWQEVASGPMNQTCAWTVPDQRGTQCRLKVEVLDAMGNLAADESSSDFTITGSSPVGEVPGHALSLAQNAPNPFNPQTDIRFTLPAKGDVSLRIYNLEGKLVRTLVAGSLAAGPHTVTWKGFDEQGGRAASGLYFYRLRTDEGVLARKMTLLK